MLCCKFRYFVEAAPPGDIAPPGETAPPGEAVLPEGTALYGGAKFPALHVCRRRGWIGRPKRRLRLLMAACGSHNQQAEQNRLPDRDSACERRLGSGTIEL